MIEHFWDISSREAAETLLFPLAEASTTFLTASLLASYTMIFRPSFERFSTILPPMWPRPTNPSGPSIDAADSKRVCTLAAVKTVVLRKDLFIFVAANVPDAKSRRPTHRINQTGYF
jgi:hypothetical protein